MLAQQVHDCEAIRNLLMRYTWCGDNGLIDDFAQTFAEDGVLDIKIQGVFQGRDAIRQGAGTGFGSDAEKMARIRAAGRFSHHLASTRIEFIDAEHARSWSYFAVLGRGGADHWGRYTDTLEKIKGEWLFARRRVSIDGAAPASIFFPDFESA